MYPDQQRLLRHFLLREDSELDLTVPSYASHLLKFQILLS